MKLLSLSLFLFVGMGAMNAAKAAPYCCQNMWDSDSNTNLCLRTQISLSCASGWVLGFCNGYQGACKESGSNTEPTPAPEPPACGTYPQPACPAPVDAAAADRTDLYYGYRGGVNQSPGSGRSDNAAKARLDACFVGGSGQAGYAVVDAITGRSGCYSACDSSTTNVACQGTVSGATPCYERCDATYASGT